MKNILKDRYTIAFSTGIMAAVGAFVLGAKHGKTPVAIALAVLAGAVLYTLFISLRGARFHLNGQQWPVKDEDGDCGFHLSKDPMNADGVLLPSGQRYKAANGTDICLKDGKPAPCGPGSALINHLRGAGLEPQSIQNDPCWE